MRASMISPTLFALTTSLILSLPGCGAESGRRRSHIPRDPGTGATPDDSGEMAFAHRIDDAHTWSELAARPQSQAISRTEIVKFVIDLEDERNVWFFDTERWDIHYHFARDILSSIAPVEDHGAFNVAQYRRPDRRFLMGSLVHYLDPDLWTMELIAGDNLAGSRVVRMFEEIQTRVSFGAELRYRPISELHETQIAPVVGQLPTISANEVFAGIQYQPLTLGVAYGTLRFIEGPLDPAGVRPDQILVLSELPDEIPISAGVITAQMQAPLGHLAVLCATRGTPNMGLREGMSETSLRSLEGRLVRLEVGAQDFRIAPAERAEAERAWAARRPSTPVQPGLDPRDRGLPDVCDLRIEDASSVGAKAAQLGEICSLGNGIRTPGGFTIPFFHYRAHLRSSGALAGIPAMVSDGAFQQDRGVQADRLGQLRMIIERTRVARGLLSDIRRKIAAFPGSPRVILRSSTNAEDLPGFTGAGLYRSVVIGANATDAELQDALRQVWSSVWLQGAYEERQWYRIEHTRVAMGVLVQPFVDGAAVNGVAITANPFYEARPAFFINAQPLGGSVTAAGGDEVPEQHLIYTYSEEIESELLSRSSNSGGRTLMGRAQIMELTQVLQALHSHLLPRWGDRANSAEVEFLLAGPDLHVVILQARPFRVVYGEGQRWE